MTMRHEVNSEHVTVSVPQQRLLQHPCNMYFVPAALADDSIVCDTLVFLDQLLTEA